VRKLITWLTLRTAAGELFDIDTALRPNGNSGLLVTSITSFESYQGGRGSNTAWTWEHQALTRARFCAGCSRAGGAFRGGAPCRADGAARRRGAAREVLHHAREGARARPVKDGRFDVKHSAGGMMDVEFAVQYLVLAQGPRHPLLLDNAGNIALLQRAEAARACCPPAWAGRRRCLPRAAPRAAPGAAGRAAHAVLALWQAVFLQA
jgi:glutamate-ammonia-ligase adenylyltransferase